jgi:flavin reductase (DIM6/NTAB) family NADH-FMN oxidoreductase RutF/DNA-binding IclR family transcriptional regulator
MSKFDQRALRDVLGTFVTGVTVVTTADSAGLMHGVTANSFSSVSLDPPMVLWSQALKALSCPAFRDTDRFAVNILVEDQTAISKQFGSARPNKFDGVSFRKGLGGVPLIDGCSAYLECRKVATYPGGDHVIFLGEIERFEHSSLRPLAFGRGRYMVAHAHEIGSFPSGHEWAETEHIDQVKLVIASLAESSARLQATLGLTVWGNKGPTLIHWEKSRRRVSHANLQLGTVLSPGYSSAGIAFSAYLPWHIVRPLIEDEIAALRLSGTFLPDTVEEIQGRLADVRRDGFAISSPHASGPDVASMSVPVWGHSGRMIAALSVVDTIERITGSSQDTLRTALLAEAASMSRRLGHVATGSDG